MNKTLITAAVLAALVVSGTASAQTGAALPGAGITPGNPLFFLDRFFEGVGTFFTFGEANKARRYLTLAEERLAEAQALAERQDANATLAAAFYEEQFAQARERAERAGDIDLESEVTEATTRHLAVFDEVAERVPEQAKAQVLAAKERSVSGQIEALRGIAQRDAERAAGIFAAAAEGRLRAAQAKAERGGDDEEETQEVQEALAEYERYAEFGQEISELAQGIGTGETEAREVVDRATQMHLEVLRDVRAKAPPQAQEGINRAMQNAERVRQLLPLDIPGRVGPGAGEQRGGELESGNGGAVPGQESQVIPPEAQQRIPQQQGAAGQGNESEQETGEAEQGAGPPAGTPGPGGRP